MVNSLKLKAVMVEAGYTQRKLAQAVGMSENTLTSKMHNRSPFTTDQVMKICEVLQIIDNRNKGEIFLA